jgi:hypothetical protein
MLPQASLRTAPVAHPYLNSAPRTIDRALDDEATRKRLTDLGCDIPPKATRGRQALGALVKSEIARWTPIIKAANIKGE